MTKSHIAWDKYELPLLVCLWFLLADEKEVAPLSHPEADLVVP